MLDELKVSELRELVPDRWDRILLNYDESKDLAVNQPASFCPLNKYKIYLELGVKFTANKVEYKRAKHAAIRRLLGVLYNDIESEALDALLAVNDRDAQSAYKALENILSICRGEK